MLKVKKNPQKAILIYHQSELLAARISMIFILFLLETTVSSHMTLSLCILTLMLQYVGSN